MSPICCLLFPSCSCPSLVLVYYFLRWDGRLDQPPADDCFIHRYCTLLWVGIVLFWICESRILALTKCTVRVRDPSDPSPLLRVLIFSFFLRLNFLLVQRIANFFFSSIVSPSKLLLLQLLLPASSELETSCPRNILLSRKFLKTWKEKIEKKTI